MQKWLRFCHVTTEFDVLLSTGQTKVTTCEQILKAHSHSTKNTLHSNGFWRNSVDTLLIMSGSSDQTTFLHSSSTSVNGMSFDQMSFTKSENKTETWCPNHSWTENISSRTEVARWELWKHKMFLWLQIGFEQNYCIQCTSCNPWHYRFRVRFPP